MCRLCCAHEFQKIECENERDKNRLHRTELNRTQNQELNRTQNQTLKTGNRRGWCCCTTRESKGNQGAIQAWREKNTSAKKILVVGRKRILREDNNNNNSDKDCFAINKKRQQTDNSNV